MRPDPSVHYETIATAFQAIDIADPLRTSAPPQWSVADVHSAIMEDAADGENWFALIRDEQKILGYLALDDMVDTPDGPSTGQAGRYCNPITPDQIVAGNLPLLDLIPLFEQHFFFFVLTGNDLTHVVSFLDLDHLPVKLCLFALITGLEAECIRLFTAWPPGIQVQLDRLSPNRYRKALDLCRERFGKEDIRPEQALLATQFIDKATILLREPAMLAALPFEGKREGERFFNQLQGLRNRIAHSDSILAELPTPREFNRLLKRLREVTNTVTQLASHPILPDDAGQPSPS